jgi:hypothetical protein
LRDSGSPYLREGSALNAERLTVLKRGLLGHLGSLGGKLTPRDVAEVRGLYESRRDLLPREAQQELEAGLAGFKAKARAVGHP